MIRIVTMPKRETSRLSYKQIFLLFVALVSFVTPSSSSLSQTFAAKNSDVVNLPTQAIASSLNQAAFLKELVSLKNAENTEYQIVQRESDNYSSSCENRISSPECISSVCEYTGTLWFFRKAEVKFRETITVQKIPHDEQPAIVECRADFYNGKKWIECATTVCEINSKNSFDEGLNIPGDTQQNNIDVQFKIKTDLLIRLPGISGQVAKKINNTFKDAVVAFMGNRHGLPKSSLTFM